MSFFLKEYLGFADKKENELLQALLQDVQDFLKNVLDEESGLNNTEALILELYRPVARKGWSLWVVLGAGVAIAVVAFCFGLGGPVAGLFAAFFMSFYLVYTYYIALSDLNDKYKKIKRLIYNEIPELERYHKNREDIDKTIESFKKLLDERGRWWHDVKLSAISPKLIVRLADEFEKLLTGYEQFKRKAARERVQDDWNTKYPRHAGFFSSRARRTEILYHAFSKTISAVVTDALEKTACLKEPSGRSQAPCVGPIIASYLFAPSPSTELPTPPSGNPQNFVLLMPS